jgi:hypothetical protein
MVNIKGLKKAEVLSVLFNHSKIQGFNAQLFERGLMGQPKNMTPAAAQSILDNMGDQKYFDYLNGKVMKVDLSSDVEFNEWGYDRDNGEGHAQRAIDSLDKRD